MHLSFCCCCHPTKLKRWRKWSFGWQTRLKPIFGVKIQILLKLLFGGFFQFLRENSNTFTEIIFYLTNFGGKIQSNSKLILCIIFLRQHRQTDKDNYQCSKNPGLQCTLFCGSTSQEFVFWLNLLSHSLKWSKVIEKCYISCSRSLKNRRLASCSWAVL